MNSNNSLQLWREADMQPNDGESTRMFFSSEFAVERDTYTSLIIRNPDSSEQR